MIVMKRRLASVAQRCSRPWSWASALLLVAGSTACDATAAIDYENPGARPEYRAPALSCKAQVCALGNDALAPSSLLGVERAKLTASNGAPSSTFGQSVALEGNTAVVGAPTARSVLGSSMIETGAAYVFVRRGGAWIEQAKLIAADTLANDWFGFPVALSGNTAVVGTYTGNSAAMAAYVFVRSAGVWTQQARLAPSEPSDSMFGFAVAIDGNLALVGAPLEGDNGESSGAAYVFKRTSGVWAQEAKLLASDGGPNDWFGAAVALSGSTALIGALTDGPAGVGSGSAYIFERSGGAWSEEQKLIASDGEPLQLFGASVTLAGARALVGAPSESGPGAAYLFERSAGAWTEADKLSPSGAKEGGGFGSSLSLAGDIAMVGAPKEDYQGAAYVFQRGAGGGWSEQIKLVESGAGLFHEFGRSVAVRGNRAMVGSPGTDVSQGAVYVYKLREACGEPPSAGYEE